MPEFRRVSCREATEYMYSTFISLNSLPTTLVMSFDPDPCGISHEKGNYSLRLPTNAYSVQSLNCGVIPLTGLPRCNDNSRKAIAGTGTKNIILHPVSRWSDDVLQIAANQLALFEDLSYFIIILNRVNCLLNYPSYL